MDRSRTGRWLGGPLALVLILILGVWTGVRGMEYGPGFDELKLLNPALRGQPLPGWYNYPSFPYYVTVGAVWINSNSE